MTESLGPVTFTMHYIKGEGVKGVDIYPPRPGMGVPTTFMTSLNCVFLLTLPLSIDTNRLSPPKHLSYPQGKTYVSQPLLIPSRVTSVVHLTVHLSPPARPPSNP